MSITYLISFETLKTFGNGALGAMTFGAYHQYTTNRIIDLNNEKIAFQQKLIEKQQRALEEKHKQDMDEIMKQNAFLKEHLEHLEKIVKTKKGWFC